MNNNNIVSFDGLCQYCRTKHQTREEIVTCLEYACSSLIATLTLRPYPHEADLEYERELIRQSKEE